MAGVLGKLLAGPCAGYRRSERTQSSQMQNITTCLGFSPGSEITSGLAWRVVYFYTMLARPFQECDEVISRYSGIPVWCSVASSSPGPCLYPGAG